MKPEDSHATPRRTAIEERMPAGMQSIGVVPVLTSPAYRPEIDGLRAVAILPVLLFHAGFDTFSGGYVGVDVFFVLSGYLITLQIGSTAEQGWGPLLRFYERRIRRILPALLLMTLACMPFAVLWMLPADRRDFLASADAVVAFYANVLFWKESGYFDATNDVKPLLHAWSLSVEEQFYLTFPMALALLRSTRRSWVIGWMFTAFVASFCLSVWGSLYRPGAAFYLLPSRAWELLVGALVAMFECARPSFASQVRFRGQVALAGMCMIGAAVLCFDRSTTFPGWSAALPVLGTTLVLLCARSDTSVHHLLCVRPLVGIGLISYSLYLWHQPILAFARHRSASMLSSAQLLALLVIAFVVAYLSWHFVEKPFRARRSSRPWHAIAMAILVAIGLFLLSGTLNWASQPGHALAPVQAVAGLDVRLRPNYGLSRECSSAVIAHPDCMTGPNPEILVWGDSYAMHLVEGLIASNPRIQLIQATASGCGPILDIAPMVGNAARTSAAQCISHNAKVMDYLGRQPTIGVVILASAFIQYLEDDAQVATSDGARLSGREVVPELFLRTILQIQRSGRVVWVVAPPPNNGNDLGRCLAKTVMFEMAASICDFDLSESNPRQAKIWSMMKHLEKAGIRVLWPQDAICAKDRCNVSKDGVFIYRDGGHLSYEGSRFLAQRLHFERLLLPTTRSEKPGPS